MFDKRVSNEVKGVAIILMLMHHLIGCAVKFCQSYGLVSSPFTWNELYGFSVSAKVCVSMYVFITAYGTTVLLNRLEKDKPMSGNELGKFAYNRYVKLISSFIFIYLLALATSFLREKSIVEIYGAGKKGVMYGIIDALGLASYFGSPSLNETWWYMTLAVLLIFAVPILIKGYRKTGFCLVVVAGYFTYVGISNTMFTRYLFCLMMGIFFAHEKVFDRIKEFKIFKKSIVNTAVKSAMYLLFLMFYLYLRQKTNWSYWWIHFLQ